MKSADINWQATGEPVSKEFNDIYFSKLGGLEETDYVFIKHNNLEARFIQCKDQFIIAETGFGTGLNFLIAAQLWQQKAPKSAQLIYYSAEKYPLTKKDLEKALTLWPQLNNVSNQLIKGYPNTLYECNFPIQIDDNITLVLLFGDAKGVFNQMDIKADAWFLDGFAPSKNESMWNNSLFKELAKLSKKDTTFATFTAASLVRKGLESYGFSVSKDKGFGSKREMLYGSYKTEKKVLPKVKPWYRPKANNQKIKQVAIIGGGLAGCAIAYELSKAKIHSTIYEKNTHIAMAASGNPVAMVRPYITLDYNVSDQFHSTGFILLEQFLSQHKHSINYNQSGLIELIQPNDQVWFDKLIKKRQLNNNVIRLVNAKEATQLANIDIHHEALYYPKCFSINPKSLCQLWIQLASSFVELKTNCDVTMLDKVNDYWQVSTQMGNYDYDAVIVAGGYQAIKQFKQTRAIPVFASVGQITRILGCFDSQTMIANAGYLVKNLDTNEYILGATYRDNDDHALTVRASDDDSNLVLLDKLNINKNEVKITASRVSMRCVTSDHMPLVGQVANCQEYDELYDYHLAKGTPWWKLMQPTKNTGLYIASGFGSKGLASSLISAKILTNTITNSVDFFPYRLKESINPARFLIRELKSKQ
ncbi:bifunctional tRNA (5-methylaminomethyl-2-thiouridine)(34)-methyltransferase MnmD/FAD-dependent 5-carboxymethylaminomethyl-2-thiouridine(34) oxidoreductase MnmC [Thiotrichales bacterium 19S3-7]|nr:bifunctional tRNA (5-methylaminomethyl-2-thiouridine)(34)-methyltransferase MnmD/FAD-dependent 5-carboxymethylaminomethyl-2-thiouridine(34) oxidoreductase MnmC [Thiotrichales bacterium 19S3-7]MCF6802988.1 bifunctional tRNA (5-methylaminomethyl-2-thiouridine)(34)-methyltransferase MnmD/FAD-dependent 5-carboxymethylaminomethyl-2-thiouridine(34) oxidoreductase MnmC [Thiotrichales bacterium 19S3-11]